MARVVRKRKPETSADNSFSRRNGEASRCPAGAELLPVHGEEPARASRLFCPVVPGSRHCGAHGGHTAHSGALPAAPVPVPEEERRSVELPEPACAPDALARMVPLVARQHYLLHNPASEIELPRLEHRLPKHVLSVQEMEQVLAQPAIHDPLGLRDRAMLETLYSTGMRRMELIHLKIFDLDTDRGMLTIRQGKGKKDRVIPIGERAAAWVEKYLREVRPNLVTEPDDRTVFLSNAGEPFCLDHLSNLVRDYVDKANIGKRGACHLFRHSMATLMLENGADIRFIQQMLGHADLNTTQIYTHVSIRKLKEIHTATHPARLERRGTNPTRSLTIRQSPIRLTRKKQNETGGSRLLTGSRFSPPFALARAAPKNGKQTDLHFPLAATMAASG